MKKVIIYTDGSCLGNPGPGGWGALLRYDKTEKQFSGSERDTTNNRMELMAAIKALSQLTEPCEVELHTDSQYLQKGITEWLPGWIKKNWRKSDNTPVKNSDLWKELNRVVVSHKITWRWVKAHNGHIENELVDALAKKAVTSLIKKERA